MAGFNPRRTDYLPLFVPSPALTPLFKGGRMKDLMWFPLSSSQKTMGAPHYSLGLFWNLDTHQSSVSAQRLPPPLPWRLQCFNFRRVHSGECKTAPQNLGEFRKQTSALTTDICGQYLLCAAFRSRSGVRMSVEHKRGILWTGKALKTSILWHTVKCLNISMYFLLYSTN